MRRYLFFQPFFLITSLFFSFSYVNATESNYLENQTFMTLSQAEKRWGKKDFSPEEFKRETANNRAKMAVNLIKKKQFIGKRPAEIKKALGEFSGHFWSDNIPTYLIEEGWNQKTDSWQLVFLLDNAGNVKEVRIHKNCCD
ncbi:MAG: hypothetical protein EBQ92_08400 [Proteobacteria bacterium]|nr:hypothetical protein [Pseudomonadota bacterium]